MHFIDELKADLTAEQRHYFNASLVGFIGTWTMIHTKIDKHEIELFAKKARKEAIENASRGNGRHS